MFPQSRVCVLSRTCVEVSKSGSCSGSQSRRSSPSLYFMWRKTDAGEHSLRKGQHFPRKVNQGRDFLLKSADELTYLTEECSVKYDRAHHRAEKGNWMKRGQNGWKVKDRDSPAPMKIRSNPGSNFFFFWERTPVREQKTNTLTNSKAWYGTLEWFLPPGSLKIAPHH